MSQKLVLISGPSGTGKTSIVQRLLHAYPELNFSISATTRTPREREAKGRDYHFMDTTTFQERIRQGDFLEYEEVYSGIYYGTLYSELERIWQNDQVPVLDIDVKGALKIKEQFMGDPLMIYIHPLSKENLRARLEQRGTDSQAKIERRLAKAEEELSLAEGFDHVIYNKNFEQSLKEADDLVKAYLKQPKASSSKKS
jgi:guanylate kinase